ncbi:MAG: putative oxidoreductase [Verrucomicrobiaceae bacterium]|nr:putative oxidoreductase [Verrucomicrobiaceae bacterium]
MTNPLAFSESERAAVYRAIAERRDMRHFKREAIADDVLLRLLHAAHCAPSVGLMQPWRFIRITDATLRAAIHALAESERRATANALGEREDEFLNLKVEGIRDCGELFVVALMDRREQHIFGRRTLPQMDLASAACAIQNLWLAARAEGLGMGWVSLFEPTALAQLLRMPEDSEPIAIICLGHVDAFYSAPMLQLERWREPDALAHCLMENYWTATTDVDGDK